MRQSNKRLGKTWRIFKTLFMGVFFLMELDWREAIF